MFILERHEYNKTLKLLIGSMEGDCQQYSASVISPHFLSVQASKLKYYNALMTLSDHLHANTPISFPWKNYKESRTCQEASQLCLLFLFSMHAQWRVSDWNCHNNHHVCLLIQPSICWTLHMKHDLWALLHKTHNRWKHENWGTAKNNMEFRDLNFWKKRRKKRRRKRNLLHYHVKWLF